MKEAAAITLRPFEWSDFKRLISWVPTPEAHQQWCDSFFGCPLGESRPAAFLSNPKSSIRRPPLPRAILRNWRRIYRRLPQTLSNWLYRSKRLSLDKYLALMEFSTQNAIMEMPPRVRKLLNELEAYAKRNRIKQQDLAKELGVVPQQLSDWLRGHRTPNAERILKIQEFLRTKNF
jgi:Helix-turn-helix